MAKTFTEFYHNDISDTIFAGHVWHKLSKKIWWLTDAVPTRTMMHEKNGPQLKPDLMFQPSAKNTDWGNE